MAHGLIRVIRYFVGYSRSVEQGNKRIVDLLRAADHDVWRDDDLPEMAD